MHSLFKFRDDDDFDLDTDSESEEISLDSDFSPFMAGDHNLHGTCFIDSVLNSIANSDSLTAHFKSILPESKYSDELILRSFNEGIKERKIICGIINDKYKSDTNITLLYEILVSIFIRGMNKYDETTLIYVRLYLMYLENFYDFNEHYKTKTKFITLEEETFYELVRKTDYNFVQYFNYCQKASNPKFTGALNDDFLVRININMEISKISDIYDKIKNNNVSDIYIKIIHYYLNKKLIKEACDACIKRYPCDYVCSDIILDKYEKGNVLPNHSVFYNINQGKLQDNSKITDTDINKLSQPSEDGSCYFPCILHFQLR